MKIIFCILVMFLFSSCAVTNASNSCKGAQKRADDTFKVMDICQQLIGCTVTVDDLRKAQDQLNLAAACK